MSVVYAWGGGPPGKERRSEVRIVLDELVVVTELNPPGQSPAGGVLKNVSGGGMPVRTPHRIAIQALVKVETKGMLMLGYVIRCEPDDDAFNVALVLRHSLNLTEVGATGFGALQN
jgi:hypothetical protein